MSLITRITTLSRHPLRTPHSLRSLRPLTTVTSASTPEPEPLSSASTAARPHHAVVSLAGQDRVGIVRTVTSAVAAHRANVEESKMAILGGDFAMIFYVSMESASDGDKLVSQLRAELPSFSISMRTTTAPQTDEKPGRAMWSLQLEGPDQPGIVAAVTQALATHGGNVHEMETETTTAPFAGYALFKMNGKVAVGDEDLGKVSEALDRVEEKFGTSISLEQIAKEGLSTCHFYYLLSNAERLSSIVRPHRLDTMRPEVATPALLQKIRNTAERALAQGALKPIETTSSILATIPPFHVRVVKGLARKNKVANNDPTASAVSRPAFNPFLPYDPAMYVQHVAPNHVLLLNKFNVVDDHVLLVTEEFEEQNSLLTAADFTALWTVLDEVDGLAFYNAGRVAGASQRHKHLQVICGEGGRAPFEDLFGGYAREVGEEVFCAGELGFLHAGVAMGGWGGDKGEESMRRYMRLLNVVEKDGRVVGDGRPFAYNLVMTRRWMVVIPRSRECFGEVSVNALGFVGCLLVRDEAQKNVVEKEGGLAVLRATTFADE